jgi:hypothetical protein
MGKKSAYKKIRRIANNLPQVLEQTHEKHIMTGIELKQEGFDENVKPINDNETYERRYPVIVQANHNRRMKQAFKKLGIEGVNQYVQQLKSKANGKTE